MKHTKFLILIALVFVPLVAWFKDATVVVLALSAMAVLLGQGTKRGDLIPVTLRTNSGLVFCAILVWTLASFMWAPHLSATAWLKAFIVIGLALVVCGGVEQTSRDKLEQLVMPIIYATFGLLIVLLVERFTGGFLVGLVRDGQATDRLLNVMNGGLVLLSGLSFSVAALLYLKMQSWRIPALFLATALVLTVTYRMDAVPVALAAGFLSSLLVLRWRACAFFVVTSVIGLGALCWPVVAYLASEADFHIWFAENVHPNWGYRIAIWGRVSELISENVLIGYGFDASRFIGETAGLIPDATGRTSFMHPHNGFLQVWLELGLVGVALFSAAAILSVRQIVRRAPNRQALAVAAGTITASSVIWLLSFGIWQGWWLAALGLNVCVVTLLFRLMGDADRARG